MNHDERIMRLRKALEKYLGAEWVTVQGKYPHVSVEPRGDVWVKSRPGNCEGQILVIYIGGHVTIEAKMFGRTESEMWAIAGRLGAMFSARIDARRTKRWMREKAAS